MSRILVTGGAGYLGSHILVALHEAGFVDVVVADDLRRSAPRMLDGVAAITGRQPVLRRIDVADAAAVRSVFAADGPFDVVIHLAAYKSVRESMAEPTRYFANNVGATAALLDVMAQHECRRLVFSSSCTVYGDAAVQPVKEDHPLGPARSPYGTSKQICEQMIAGVADASDGRFPTLTRAMALRYFNPVGAHPSALIGELPMGVPDTLVPFMAESASGVRGPLEVFGSDYPTPDGTARRDYLHVVDLAEAHVAAVHWALGDSPRHDVVNLGTGRPFSVLEVIASFERVTGVPVPHVFSPRRAGDAISIWSAVDKAAQVLGWRATRTIDDMLSSAWAWHQRLAHRKTE